MSTLDDWKRRLGMASAPPLREWFFVSFNETEITLTALPPGAPSWSERFAWGAVIRVCLTRERSAGSGTLHVFTSARPESYEVPLEAGGGHPFYDELLRRGLFPAELALAAAAAGEGTHHCWPPIGETRHSTKPGFEQWVPVLKQALMLVVFGAVLVWKFHPFSLSEHHRDHQVQHHRPISESDSRKIQGMALPSGGPLEGIPLMNTPAVNFYRVHAANGHELEQQIRQLGPHDMCQKDCATYYHWGLMWKWDDVEKAGQCTVMWGNAIVSMDYTLPVWINEKDAPVALRERYGDWIREIWGQFNEATRIVNEEAAALELRLNALPPMPCSDLDRRTQEEGYASVSVIEDRIARMKVPGQSGWAWMQDY